ncbi:MAG TPA: hypothetical protein VI793_14450 [Anaerolineales bacterium]|nr:hypothetical protein [Anaerolineales bacterium]
MLQVEIRIKGQIDEHWSAWFEGLTITHTAQGETILSGELVDQAALYGLLAKLRDLGLSLLSVNSEKTVAPDEQHSPSANRDC